MGVLGQIMQTTLSTDFFLTLDCYAHRVSFYEAIGFVQNLIQPVVLPYDSPISMRMGLDLYLEKVGADE